MPPQVNATLTRVQSATALTANRDDWDATMTGTEAEPAGAGADKWTGTVAAFLEESIDRQFGPNGVEVLERRRLYIDSADARTLGVDTDDVVTFTDHAGVTRTATAIGVAIAELDGIPRELQTATLELRPA